MPMLNGFFVLHVYRSFVTDFELYVGLQRKSLVVCIDGRKANTILAIYPVGKSADHLQRCRNMQKRWRFC